MSPDYTGGISFAFNAMNVATIKRAGKTDKAMGLVSLGMVIVMPIIYWALPERYHGAGGLFGKGLGVVALSLAFISIAYSIRRMRMQYRWGNLEVWLRIHIYAGLLALLFAFLHADWRFQPGAATAALLLLVLTNISGLIGWIIYIYGPDFLEPQDAQTFNAPEEIYSMMSKLQSKRDLLEQKILKTGDSNNRLSEESSSIEKKMLALRRELKLSLRREMLMGLWLCVHIPLSAAFVVTVSVHVFVIFYL